MNQLPRLESMNYQCLIFVNLIDLMLQYAFGGFVGYHARLTMRKAKPWDIMNCGG
jgi:hypothetical protein